MRTDDLIAALATDGGRVRTGMTPVLSGLTLIAALVAGLTFAVTIGPRPDLAHAASTIRFLFKFVVTLALAGTTFWLLLRTLRPGATSRRDYLVLLLAPVLIVSAVVAELFALPQTEWASAQLGTNSLVCLTYIPVIGIGPLALFLGALRHGAPTRPGLAGVIAGVLAGGMAATFYAAQCTDDSPLFVITWYPLAIAILAVAGGLAGKAIARW